MSYKLLKTLNSQCIPLKTIDYPLVVHQNKLSKFSE